MEISGAKALVRIRRLARWQWPAEFPLVQFPNPPLLVALASSAATPLAHGMAHRAVRALFFLSLGLWAYEEARHGDNWFRRLLGLGFCAYLIADLAKALRP